MKTADYYPDFIGELKERKAAAAYLDAAVEDGDTRVFLPALRR